MEKNIFHCSADHEQDWQPYPVDPYPAMCDDNILIHTSKQHVATSSIETTGVERRCSHIAYINTYISTTRNKENQALLIGKVKEFTLTTNSPEYCTVLFKKRIVTIIALWRQQSARGRVR